MLDSVGSQDLMIGTVPEPTTAALIVLGGVFFLRRRSAK
ncbi:MAG: PEP-CTERM sorting domain-containing protein [Planctomycetes bacterium]|nr:PEP-CTERM sorting domain-containing protein [Planctomycetota bacterium]